MATQRFRGADDEVIEGSGDIFADLGIELSPEEALKVEIALQISRTITSRGLTQVQVGELVGIDQAKVSQITRGRLKGFSIERLMRLLAALGWDIDIRFRPSKGRRGGLTAAAEAPTRLRA